MLVEVYLWDGREGWVEGYELRVIFDAPCTRDVALRHRGSLSGFDEIEFGVGDAEETEG